MKGSHDIYIMKAGDGYRVRPAVWSTTAAKAGNRLPKVTFRNLTDKQVVVVLPPTVIHDPANPAVVLNPVRTPADPQSRDEGGVDLKSKLRGAAPGKFHYSVFVITDDGAVRAAGESEPIIIIDPPA